MADHRTRDEIAKKTRRDVLTVLLLATTVIFTFLMINKFTDVHDLEQSIAKKQDDRKLALAHNKKVEKQQDEQIKNLGTEEVTNVSSDFNDKLYDWKSWEEYTNNMNDLVKTFPNIDNGNVVDLAPTNVGVGESPESSHDQKVMTTTNKGEIAEFITQTKKTDVGESEALWYKVSEYHDGRYDVSYLKPFKKAL